VLRYLHENHNAPRLAAKTPKVATPAPRNVTATAEERALVLNAAPRHMRVWLLLCSDLALRSGTAARIAPENYNPETRELSFRTKFSEAQTLPVTEELAELFAEHKEPTAVPYVVGLHTGRAGYKGSANGLRVAFAQLRRKLGITRQLTPHDFRRTTAVLAYNLSKDLRVVQAVLGHKHLQTTLHYLDHRMTPVDRGVLEAIKLNEMEQQ